jgi:nucleoid DNA-binding protein
MSEESLTKAGLTDAIAQERGLTKEASRDVINTILNQISKQLSSGGRVTLRGLGTFYVEQRDGRRYWDIHEEAIRTSDPRTHVMYRPSKRLVDEVQDD